MLRGGENKGSPEPRSPSHQRIRLQDLSEFVVSIYDTALEPDAWLPMLNRLADLLAATTGAHFGSYNSRTYITRNVAPRFDPKYIRSFAEYWAAAIFFGSAVQINR